jgi:uncharacterized membrane protein
VSPIADYLDELSALLPRASRRRILAEVESHLRDAVAARCARGEHLGEAELAAAARFGDPAEVARQFNAVQRRPRAIGRRVLAVSLATAATASLGTATVWATGPGGAHHPHVVHHSHIAGHRTP